jgi:hypothetical protein
MYLYIYTYIYIYALSIYLSIYISLSLDGRLDLSEPLLLGVILAPVFEVCGTFVPCGVFYLLP